MTEFTLSPSILSANFAKLGEEVTEVLAAGAQRIHIDVMDNHYVPNLTFGPIVCEALRKHGIEAPLDVHLMTKPVDRLIARFAESGATSITFHPEASEHIDRSLSLIKHYGCEAGLALNPATPLNYLDYVWEKLDLILIMSVNPGFGGQDFIENSVEKIRAVAQLIDKSGKSIRLAVDGGVKIKNVKKIAEAGADTFIIGSAIFNTDNYDEVVQAFQNELLKVKKGFFKR